MTDLSEAADASRRVRFQGIVEAERREPAEFRRVERAAAMTFRERDYARLARQAELVSRFCAIFIFFALMVGWPVGAAIGYWSQAQSLRGFSMATAFPAGIVMFALIVPVMIWLLGYIVSRMATMMSASEAIAAAAQHFVQPDQLAVDNVRHVGSVVRGEMDALNAGIDDALIRLASVEAMIRQHVAAIEQAGASIETRATSASDRVASERVRLIELTETLNARADDFAVAIAEKAQANLEALQSADRAAEGSEGLLDERLARLEAAAGRALQSFTALRDALVEADDHMRGAAGSIEASAEGARLASEKASAVADAAAESAARNAANIGQFAARAAEEAKKSASESIEAARTETARAADAAVEHASREARRVADAAARALEGVRGATESAVAGAAGDAEKAAAAADLVSEAAKRAMAAAHKASEEVRKAGESAKANAQEALALSEAASGKFEARNRELAEARAALEKENARLETLIEEQRKRADRLAEAIATQTERLSKLAESQLREQEASVRLAEAQASLQPRPEGAAKAKAPTPQRGPREGPEPRVLDLSRRPKQPAAAPRASEGNGAGERARKEGVSWREILTATDDAAPLELGGADKRKADNAASAMATIGRLQGFTLGLESRLYGEPPPALLERFERGDRNIFANRLLRLNESDVKRRIRSESARDKGFESGIHDFLQGFERLLEDATTSETADEELEEYLSSPLGRVYLLIGATVGYFA